MQRDKEPRRWPPLYIVMIITPPSARIAGFFLRPSGRKIFHSIGFLRFRFFQDKSVNSVIYLISSGSPSVRIAHPFSFSQTYPIALRKEEAFAGPVLHRDGRRGDIVPALPFL